MGGRYEQLSAQQDDNSQMLHGYFQMLCVEPTQQTSFKDWMERATEYARDTSVDLHVRAVFGLLAGSDAVYRQVNK